MTDMKRYDVMVRVEFTWENEYGDERTTWATNIGQYTSNNPDSLPEYVAAHHIKFEPPGGENVRRVLFSEITQYTLNEVD
ncbi:hypothetical protein SEA_PARADIDDLES_208 [Streptomyces phage Paradiddles]|jgi:hypothetical protein|uniref:Uncharacterized protein n=2 Tax=Samistivirus TaxID=2560220 RepID=A0A222Z100_9CAUD|nr:hypothetical protein FDI36_gp085 [Streptomyces phage NootNoot]YP_009611159.1 hypothetical protein FDI37_gp086 [Streptomyces phage Paradiddles]ASR77436.1 hypothetical protein SEA_NOOTNOOT_213 [Streptomyces phage NootNoot]ASR77637.1 hypothetical protein SEA_PARADIDDLES_208 [Streptomyces phage Paradiddles]